MTMPTPSTAILDALPAPPAGRTGWPWTEAGPRLAPAMPDGEPWPRITIVTPSYNQAAFLEATLRSVILQGYPSLQFIVMDGGSPDASPEIIARYDRWIDFWASERDEGQPDAINKGFARADGEILAWLNSDDLFLPGALEHIALLSRERPEAVAWVGRCYRIDEDDRITDTIAPRGLDEDTLADWGYEGFFYQPSCFFTAEGWRKTGPMDLRLEYGFDVDLWIKLAKIGPFVATDEVLSAALFHPMAKSGQGRMGQHVDTNALQVYHGHLDAAIKRLDNLVESRRVRELLRLSFGTRLRSIVGRLRPDRTPPLPRLQDVVTEHLAGNGRVTAPKENG